MTRVTAASTAVKGDPLPRQNLQMS